MDERKRLFSMTTGLTIMPAAAALDLSLSASDVRVLMVLGTYINRSNRAYPSQTTLADKCGLSRQTVNKSLKKLCEKGYVVSQHQYSGGCMTVCLYEVVMQPHLLKQAAESLDVPAVKKSDSAVNPRGDSAVNPEGDTENPSNKTTTIIKDEPLSAKDWFDEFEKVLSFNDFPNLASGWSAKSHQWMARFDLHKDCIPVIKRLIKGKPRGSIHSWGYFEQAIADHQLNRLKPIPEGNTNDKPNNYSNSNQRKGTVERTIDLLEGGGDLPDIF